MGKPSAAEGRIKRLTLEEARERAGEAEVADVMAELSIFRVLLHHPRLARAIHRMLASLLFNAKLDTRLRELVIMRIGWTTGSNYEWTQHWRVARALGIEEADLLAVRDWRSAEGLSAADRAVLAATDETLVTGRISPETWAECETHVGGRESLLELVAAIGLWSMVSTVVRSLEVPLEDGVEAWPPDGRIPPALQERSAR